MKGQIILLSAVGDGSTAQPPLCGPHREHLPDACAAHCVWQGLAARRVWRENIGQPCGRIFSVRHISWDAYNETADLEGQAEAFRQRFGHDPASIHADKIYQTRANRAWRKERGIRLSGKPLGRPRELTADEKKRQRQDEKDRITIEGKFGNAKRKGTLQRIMAKLAVTSITVVAIGLITLNLDALPRFVLVGPVWARIARQPASVCRHHGTTKRGSGGGRSSPDGLSWLFFQLPAMRSSH
jgi:hypothetical protein